MRILRSDDGQTLPRDFAVEVEGVDIRHTGDVVHHPHDAVVQKRPVNLVLVRDTVQQQAAVGFVGMDHRIGQEFQQHVDDVVARKFNVQDLAVLVDILSGKVCAGFERGGASRRDVFYQGALEPSLQDVLLVMDKSFNALITQERK